MKKQYPATVRTIKYDGIIEHKINNKQDIINLKGKVCDDYYGQLLNVYK
jgi:hypothetical protein